MVRIRPNNAIVTKLTFSKEQLQKVEEIKQNPYKFGSDKADKLKKALGKSLCLSCRLIPDYEVTYRAGSGGRVVEFYCEPCLQSVYTKNKDRSNSEIAAEYDCIIRQ